MKSAERMSVLFNIDDKEVKTRKQRRKEARQAKMQQRLHSWTSHQAIKRRSIDAKASVTHSHGTTKETLCEQEIEKEGIETITSLPKKSKKRKARKAGTRFQHFLEMDRSKESVSAKEDLRLEQKFAKRLKVKGGKLRDASDGLSDLLAGIGSSSTDVDDDNDHFKDQLAPASATKEERNLRIASKSSVGAIKEGSPASAKKKRKLNMASKSSDGAVKEDLHHIAQQQESSQGTFKKLETTNIYIGNSEGNEHGKKLKCNELSGSHNIHHTGSNMDVTEDLVEKRRVAEKYVPPHLRGGSGSAEHIRVQRQIRGLLNRLSEVNVESITSDVSDAIQAHGRRLVGQIVTTEIMGACCRGPRGNEQYAAVFAAFVAGITSLVGMDFGANFVAALASSLEEEYGKKDGLAVRNLTLLISFLYTFSLLASDMIFDLLGQLSRRFEELDVATILQLLQTCGIGLRNQDPSTMKEFIMTIQQRSIELKESFSSLSDEKTEGINKRVKFMLEAICEIKNNKRRSKDEPAHHARLKKWLQKLRVEDVQLRSVSWKTLIDPEKKGQWWLPGSSKDTDVDHVTDIVDAMDTGAAEAEKMLKLAVSQRMNTDARRAIFCIIMTGEDYIDAFEKLLRMKLPGKQDREIIRVILECCLQEIVFNKYYVLLTSKLCQHDKNHKFTLQVSYILLWNIGL
ncbi:hypothetical protein O6H91_11G010400 [Diphasiastrum complanatum]|uniref:Uncharacterized protein n=1 Tax=Diphasiastrum complanatum TaxID=34168 RepID=A0ACC2C671_DIPCM|nr:hypothetical protein O6H91_11G010400 [Diphasiastrum complanatum]